MKLRERMWELMGRKVKLTPQKVKLTCQAKKFHPIKPQLAAFRFQRKATKEAFA